MEFEKKISWIKCGTIAVAELALVLTIVLFVTGVSVPIGFAIALGILAITAVIYLGLIGIESLGTERENIRVTEKANRVIDTVAHMDKYFEEIFKRIDESEAKNEKAIRTIASTLQLIQDSINLKATAEELKSAPKKKK